MVILFHDIYCRFSFLPMLVQLPASSWLEFRSPCPVPSAVTMGKPLKRPAAKKPASKKRPAAAKRQRLAEYKKDPTNQSTLCKTNIT